MTQQQSTNTLSEDTRGIGRSIVVGLLGVALVGFVVFMIFRGAILDSSTSDPAPETEADDGPETEQLRNNDTDNNESDDMPPEDDTPETVDIDVNVWVQEIGEETRYSTLTLRNESGGIVKRKSLTLVSSLSFENLSYDDEYTLTVEVDQWPDERIEFNAGDFEERDVVVTYEFKAADSFRFVAHEDHKEIKTGVYRFIGSGESLDDAGTNRQN